MEQLNIKVNNWRDLLTDEEFTRADLITIQNPDDLTKFNISQFHHVKKNLRIENEGRISTIVASGLTAMMIIWL